MLSLTASCVTVLGLMVSFVTVQFLVVSFITGNVAMSGSVIYCCAMWAIYCAMSGSVIYYGAMLAVSGGCARWAVWAVSFVTLRCGLCHVMWAVSGGIIYCWAMWAVLGGIIYCHAMWAVLVVSLVTMCFGWRHLLPCNVGCVGWYS